MGRPGVLFDVDGTLVDTNYLHTIAWARAFADHGRWAPMNAIHRLVGQGGDQLTATLIGQDDPALSRSRHRRYEELRSDIRAFPAAGALLEAVHQLGLAVVLATSSPADELEASRRVLERDDVIDAVTTADDVDASKPDPDIFVKAAEVAGVDRRRALVVGDSVWDVRAAAAAGMGCVAVETGGFSHHELSEAGALHVYRDAEQLRDWLLTSPIAQLAPH
ncbi:MAG: HAD family hydrolase [Acidobacteriota bacterium]|nr:HAD family hydrolase [Acidobacteriota bacterium]